MVVSSVVKTCFAALLVASCGGTYPARVSADDYAKYGKCWINGERDLSAFLIMVRVDKGYVPYLLSAKCVPHVEGMKTGAVLALSTGAINLSDPKQVLKYRLRIDRPVIDSEISDLPGPSSKDPVYYIVAKVSRDKGVGNSRVSVLGIKRIEKLTVSYLQIVEMSDADRTAIGLRQDGNLL